MPTCYQGCQCRKKKSRQAFGLTAREDGGIIPRLSLDGERELGLFPNSSNFPPSFGRGQPRLDQTCLPTHLLSSYMFRIGGRGDACVRAPTSWGDRGRPPQQSPPHLRRHSSRRIGRHISILATEHTQCARHTQP